MANEGEVCEWRIPNTNTPSGRSRVRLTATRTSDAVAVRREIIYVRLFATNAEKINKSEERIHRQRQTYTLVNKTNLQY